MGAGGVGPPWWASEDAFWMRVKNFTDVVVEDGGDQVELTIAGSDTTGVTLNREEAHRLGRALAPEAEDYARGRLDAFEEVALAIANLPARPQYDIPGQQPLLIHGREFFLDNGFDEGLEAALTIIGDLRRGATS